MKKILLNKYLWVAIVALIAGIAYSWRSNQKEKQVQQRQSTTKVERADLIQRATISGTVTPLRKTIITAPYQGYIRKMYVKLGQDVKSGDPIASVGATLLASDMVYPLRSPFAGKVVQVNKSEGEFIKATDESDFIARVDDISKMYIDANVPELDRVRMTVGLEATVKASAILNRSYKGVIRELSLAARERDRYGRSTAVEFPMRLEILDFDEKIQPGMSVIVDIITLKKENVLRVRHEFIGQEKGQYFLTLAKGQRVNVELGDQNEEYSEIKSGVDEGAVIQKVDFSKLIKEK